MKNNKTFVYKFKVYDVTCETCIKRIESKLRDSVHVREIVFIPKFSQGLAEVELELNKKIEKEIIIKAIEEASKNTRHNYIVSEIEISDK